MWDWMFGPCREVGPISEANLAIMNFESICLGFCTSYGPIGRCSLRLLYLNIPIIQDFITFSILGDALGALLCTVYSTSWCFIRFI